MAKEKRIVIAFGRFNPPTTGHARLITFLTQTANRLGADARVYASPTTDAKKNPLPFREKVQFLRQLFPRVTFNNNSAINTPFAAYADASAAGYKDITVIVGADRVRDFEKFGAYLLPAGSSKYNAAKHIDVSQYRVLAIPRGAGAISATLMRGYVVANDFPSFLAGTPGRNTTVAKKIFTSLRRHMRIREQKAYHRAMQQKVLEAQAADKSKAEPSWWTHTPKDRKQAMLRAKKKRDSVKLKNEGPLDWSRVDKRHRPPIAEHPFHKLDNMKLRYIQKDAGEAAKAMRGHDKRAEAKYLDQVNDASTILNYRRRGGKQLKEATGSPSQQSKVANEIYKLLTGQNFRDPLGRRRVGPGFSPAKIIDLALRDLTRTPNRGDREVLRNALNRATNLGIKWNKEKLRGGNATGVRLRDLTEAPTKLGRPAAPVGRQMDAARIIHKSLTGSESRGLTGKGWKKTPQDVINDAVRHFLKGRHTPEGWRIAGKILNKATELGIKWDQKLLKPMTRYAMKMDESTSHWWLKPSGEILKPGTRVKIPSGGIGQTLRGKIVRYDKGAPRGTPFYVVDVGKYASEKVPVHQVVKEAASVTTRAVSALKPPSEVDRLKVRQTTDLITLKQRQATELMAAKIRDVETKAREAQTKATAPKGAAVSAS